MPKMTLQALALQLLLLVVVKIEGNPIAKAVQQNATNASSWSSLSSPWLKKVVNQRPTGCRNRPWVCSQEEFPPRSLCCRNRCVDANSDINNCGLCGIRCMSNRQCCRGLCIDTNISPLNCGKCGTRCPTGRLCLFGMCGYGQPSPPWPFLSPPPFPRPPVPFRPTPWAPKQKPPRPPVAQPPHQPHPPPGYRPPPPME